MTPPPEDITQSQNTAISENGLSNNGTLSKNLGLFVSCLVDLTRPSVGFSVASLLEAEGCTVTVPPQSCCGQPAYNNGNRREAADIAIATIRAFEAVDQVIVPSASCAGMICHHYPALLEDRPEWQQKATELAARTREFSDYLWQLRQSTTNGKQTAPPRFRRIGYHESCSARREMKVKGATQLLAALEGGELVNLPGNEECCGFGGLFSVKFDEISNAMAETKTRKIIAANVDVITGVDLGCLMNIAGKLKQEGAQIPVFHLAELLANDLSTPSI